LTLPLFLLSAHEHLVQFGKGYLEPGRAAVIALSGAFGLLHLAQQRVHLGDVQDAVGTHRAMAGKRGKQFIAPFGQRAACSEFTLLIDHVVRGGFRFGLPEHHRHRAHRQRVGRKRRDVETEFFERILFGFHGGHFQFVGKKTYRDQ
jgi:hypothetical protein